MQKIEYSKGIDSLPTENLIYLHLFLYVNNVNLTSEGLF